ncbi:MAG: hypothetical protein IJS47_03060 [Clostridia bacterium]|nr:hypothetical protein [Clostridia bacterium]
MEKRWKAMVAIGALIGALIFILLYGTAILDVTYDDWLLVAKEDETNSYIGWLFLRKSAFSFPLGQVSGLLYPYVISILHSDSVPLLAIFFRAFNKFLPETFQYFGWFVFLCFILQGALSTILINKIIKNKVISCLSSVFFCIAPILLIRAFGHMPLCAHFIILLAMIMWVYKDELSTKKRMIICTVEVLLCISIEIYFLPMAFTLLFFMLLYEVVNKKIKIWNGVFLLLYFLFCVLVFSLLFESGSNAKLVQYAIPGEAGQCSLNFNAFFNPGRSGFNTSSLFNMLPDFKEGDYEGYSYLGLGLVCLLMIGVFGSIYNKIGSKKDCKKIKFAGFKKILESEYFYIILCAVFLICIAALPRFTFNDKLLFTLPLPRFVTFIFAMLRANGRFIWPVWYLILTFSIYLVNKNFSKNSVIVILCLCLIIQHIDIHPVYDFESETSAGIVYESPLKSAAWDEILKGKKEIFVLDELSNRRINGNGAHEFTYEILAFKNDMVINDTYSSRKNDKLLDHDKEIESNKIFSGNADSEKIYVFYKKPMLEYLKCKNFYVYNFDGEYIGLADKLSDQYTPISAEDVYTKYNIGELVNFTSTGENEIDGVINKFDYFPEDAGTWTDDDESIYFWLGETEDDLYLNINVVGTFVPYDSKIIINDSLEYKIDLQTLGQKKFYIPSSLLTDKFVKANILVDDIKSPYELYNSDDVRQLGLQIESISLTEN